MSEGPCTRDVPLGDACEKDFHCASTGSRPRCAASTGAIGTVCCRNQGGSCRLDRHCCGDLSCHDGVCGGGGAAVGTNCGSRDDCAPVAPQDGWATCAEVGGEFRCCLVEGSWCSFDWECCGDTDCGAPGICGGAAASGLTTGAYCSSPGLCSYRAADACEGNGDEDDGPTNCCWFDGGYCGIDAHCCGDTRCLEGVCGGTVRGDVPPQPRQNAATVAVWLSRQEEAGAFDAMYEWLHPDAQAIVPREAVVGWYRSDFAPRGPEALEVTGVVYNGWVWQVTGVGYPGAAIVFFRQPFADGTVVKDQVHLVKDDESRWRWFFGRDRAFVDETIRRFA